MSIDYPLGYESKPPDKDIWEKVTGYSHLRIDPSKALEYIFGLHGFKLADSIAELGCGPVLHSLSNPIWSQSEVVAVDRHMAALLKLRKPNRVQPILADMLALPLTNSCANVVLSVATLHYFNVEELRLVFSEIERVLVSTGQAYLITQTRLQASARFEAQFFPSFGLIDSLRFHSIDDIIMSLQGTGLALDSIETISEQVPVSGTYRSMIENRLISGLVPISDVEFDEGLRPWRIALRDLSEFWAEWTIISISSVSDSDSPTLT